MAAGKLFAISFMLNAALGSTFNGATSKAIGKIKELQQNVHALKKAGQDASAGLAQLQKLEGLYGRMSTAKKGFGDSLASLGRTASVITSISAPLAGAVSTAMDFQGAMSKVKAITGASADDMDKLSQVAQKLGSTTQFSATQAAEAMSYLGMAGWNTNQIMSGMPGLLSLAAASGAELATVADIVSDDLTAFGMSAEQAGHMADVFAAASTNANTNVEMMGETFKYAAPVAGALGYSLEDVAIATGLMANAGIKGEQAGTSLRATMSRLVDPPAEAAKALSALGVSATNADGTMKPLSQTMKELRKAFANLSESEKAEKASAIAGTNAMSGFLAVVNAGDDDFNKLSDAINNSDGTAQKMAETMQNNLQGAITKIKSALEGAGIAIGSAFLPALQSIGEAIADITGKFAEWANENQNIIQILGGVVAGLSAATLGIQVFATASASYAYAKASLMLYVEVLELAAMKQKALNTLSIASGFTWSNVMQKIGAGFKFVGAGATFALSRVANFALCLQTLSFGGILRGLLGLAKGLFMVARAGLIFAVSPLGAALIAIAGAAYLIYNNWSTIAPLFDGVFGQLQTAVASAWAMLQPAFEQLKIAFSELMQALAPLLPVLQFIGAILGGVLVGAIYILVNAIVGGLSMAISFVSSVATGMIGIFSGIIQFLTGVFTGDLTTALDGIKNVFQSVFDMIGNIVQNTLSSMLGSIANIGSAVRSVLSLGSGGGGGTEVAHNARGGIYNKGAFLTTFAEDSPEAAIPLDGSQRAIGLWRQAGEMLGIGTGNTLGDVSVAPGGSQSVTAPPINITINVNGDASGSEIKNAVLDAGRRVQQSFAEQMAMFAHERGRVSFG